jgi:lipoprotein signal peptidase
MNLGILNLRTGIFNFADVWITAGVISLLFMGKKNTGLPQPPTVS